MQEEPKVLQLTLTYNRHKLLERNVASFLEQDYEGPHTLFIYNTGEPVELDDFPLSPNKTIILINNRKDYISGKEYTSVGDKYRDVYTHLDGYDIVTHLDDDDFALPDNITQGVVGINKAKEQGKLSYKPKKSWFFYHDNVYTAENVCEGSIFIDFPYMKTVTFPSVSVKYHDCWVHPLAAGKMLVDPEGKPTWIYDWGNYSPAYKMSGRADTPENYKASQALSRDIGDGLITPLSKEVLYSFYERLNILTS